MLNRNAVESLNENSLIVNNVIDTKSEHSAAQTQPSRSISLIGLRFLSAQRETFISILLIRQCVIAALVQSERDKTIER